MPLDAWFHFGSNAASQCLWTPGVHSGSGVIGATKWTWCGSMASNQEVVGFISLVAQLPLYNRAGEIKFHCKRGIIGGILLNLNVWVKIASVIYAQTGINVSLL